MVQPFETIVAGLEKVGAFVPMPGTENVFPGYRNSAEDIRDAKQVQAGFMSVFNGFKVYLPMHHYHPWASGWSSDVASKPFDSDMTYLMASHIHVMNSNLEEYRFRDPNPVIKQPKPSPGFAGRKVGREGQELLEKVISAHPQLLASICMLQASQVVFLRSLLEEMNQNNPYDATKTQIATKAINMMAGLHFAAEFDVPMAFIAVAFHDRITKNRTIPPDYTLPMCKEDFIEGWRRITSEGGFVVDYSKVTGADRDESGLPVRRCPFGTRAANDELCSADDGGLRRQMAMGLSTWDNFEKLSRPSAVALHEHVYKTLQNPDDVAALNRSSQALMNGIEQRVYYNFNTLIDDIHAKLQGESAPPILKSAPPLSRCPIQRAKRLARSIVTTLKRAVG